jgi:hypothetical protein
MTLDEILENYPEEEFLKADGFDGAIIGVDPISMRLIYDRNAMVAILTQDDEMEEIDAIEYLEFNTWNTYFGDQTPIYIEI